MRSLNVLLSILVSLLIGVLVLEGGLRLVGLGPKKTLMQPHDQLGWSKVPGRELSRSTREFDVRFAINEEGLREEPIGPKGPDVFRVLCLGDSFVLGFAVDHEESFCDLLEEWWHAEGRKVEVINAGTEGWSTDQAVRWLELEGAALQPDLVLLFPYENDVYWNGQTAYVDGTPKPRYAPDGTLENSELVLPPETWKDRFAIGRTVDLFFGDRSEHQFEVSPKRKRALKEWGALLVEPPEFIERSWQHTRGALIALRRATREMGATAVVVPIPSHSSVDAEYRAKFEQRVLKGIEEDAWSPDEPVRRFLETAQDVGLATLDPRDALREGQGSEPLYNSIDWHLNEAGNRALAKFLHGTLDASLGAQGTAQRTAAMPVVEDREAPRRWPYWFGGLLVALSCLYIGTYPKEPKWSAPLKVGGMLALIFAIVLGGEALLGKLPPMASIMLLIVFVVGLLTFVAYKLGRRLGTIAELFGSFVRRGHWYLMPLVVVLLTIGSLLVVAASSPLVAPFIYTLF